MINSISMITLGVTNVEKSIKFYGSIGFEYSKNSDPEMCIFMRTGSISLGLVEYDFLAKDSGMATNSKQTYNGFTMAINGNSVEEVNNIIDNAVKAGGKLQQKAQWKDWAGNQGYSGYILDLDGFVWEIAYAPFLKLNDSGILEV